MSSIKRLNEEEKMFIAGCIKQLIMVDGNFEEEELLDLDRITGDLQFDEYEASLEAFEEQIVDEESFWEVADHITDTSTQELIITVLYELAIQDGIIEDEEETLIQRLKEHWGME
jgi:uncharacterized tellurite resistance protein B-like protein